MASNSTKRVRLLITLGRILRSTSYYWKVCWISTEYVVKNGLHEKRSSGCVHPCATRAWTLKLELGAPTYGREERSMSAAYLRLRTRASNPGPARPGDYTSRTCSDARRGRHSHRKHPRPARGIPSQTPTLCYIASCSQDPARRTFPGGVCSPVPAAWGPRCTLRIAYASGMRAACGRGKGFRFGDASNTLCRMSASLRPRPPFRISGFCSGSDCRY